MKLVYKGIFKDDEQLPKGVLPENAVKFKEPDTLRAQNKKIVLPSILCVLLIVLFVVVSNLLHGEEPISAIAVIAGIGGLLNFTIIGLLFSFLAIAPHEFLHAIFFPKDAEVELYLAPKHLAAFVTCVQPISKLRFIILSLFPSFLLGWIPLIIWVILPHYGSISRHLYTFAVFGILSGVGDYLNVFRAIRHMPKGSMQQLSGFNSYWFMP